MRVHNSKKFIERRRELRQSATETEKIVWEELRTNKLGFKFKRQHSIDGYILDFFCPSKRLIVEIDGGIHESQKEYDNKRDKFFTELGYTILRFKNLEITSDLKKVIIKIQESLKSIPFSLPRRRGREEVN